LESAASWGFKNHFGKEQYFPMVEHLNTFFAEWQKRSRKQVPTCFLDRGRNLISEYNRLAVGQFFVLGVPANKLTDWMYDAKPFYIPTGKDIRSVVEKPAISADEGTIATLMLAKEVLNPTSGLVVISVDKTDSFCKGLDLIDPSYIPLYRSITCSASTAFEEREMKVRDQLQLKLKQFSSDFMEWSKTGHFSIESSPTEEPFYDFPQSLP
jgi:hypothetical protein